MIDYEFRAILPQHFRTGKHWSAGHVCSCDSFQHAESKGPWSARDQGPSLATTNEISSLLNQRSEFAHTQDHHERFEIRERPEAKALIKGFRLFVIRLHNDRSRTNEVGRCQRPSCGVYEQVGTEPLSLVIQVDGELAEQNDRNRLGHVS